MCLLEQMMTNSLTFKEVQASLMHCLSLATCRSSQTTGRLVIAALSPSSSTCSGFDLSFECVWQVVLAAAAAAGLNRNGIRRTAFSTGDLQALSVMPPKSSPSPPDPSHINLHRCALHTSGCTCSCLHIFAGCTRRLQNI